MRRRFSKNKYGAIKTAVDGIVFASGKEANRFIALRLLERAGEISELTTQPKFWLEINGKPILIKSKGYPNGRRASFKPDFKYRRKDGAWIVEDTKSVATRTEAFALRRGVFEVLFPEYIFIEG